MPVDADRIDADRIDADSLERLVPDHVAEGDATGRDTLALHMARYEFAAKHARGPRILDMACGVGYGTRYLVDHAPADANLTGVDLSRESIDYAQKRYATPRIRFLCSDATQFREAEPFDTIVSLETIEHIPGPAAFVSHLVSLLKPGGVLIGSVPTTPSVDANPHHVNDFSSRSFRRLFLRHGLREIDSLKQIQPYSPVSVTTRSEARARDLRKNLPLYYLTHPHSFVSRVWTTLRHGFNNHYETIVWQKP